MNTARLEAVARSLVDDGKGLVAIDESIPTCNRRFAALGMPQTAEARRPWRELIVTVDGLGESISGAILCDETIRQEASDGTPLVDVRRRGGVMPGIKVDLGAAGLAGSDIGFGVERTPITANPRGET